jgi:hypothetical protein
MFHVGERTSWDDHAVRDCETFEEARLMLIEIMRAHALVARRRCALGGDKRDCNPGCWDDIADVAVTVGAWTAEDFPNGHAVEVSNGVGRTASLYWIERGGQPHRVAYDDTIHYEDRNEADAYGIGMPLCGRAMIPATRPHRTRHSVNCWECESLA